MSITLSPQQIIAFDQIMRWFEDPREGQTFALAGYAGTGKSTLAKMIAAECGRTIYLAYTGKAANVLREKGCENVSTIHSAIYDFIGEDADGQPTFDQGMDVDLHRADLVIVDEYSMLPAELINDLEASGARKILYLGDPFQIPPVNGECPIEANYFLTEIHRQALDSPILRAANKVRMGESLSFCDEGAFKYLPKNKTNRQMYLDADQVICGRNITRQSYNKTFRKFLGFEGDMPRAGEKLICLKNNKKVGVFNGMIDTAVSDARPGVGAIYHLDIGGFRSLTVWNGDVKGEKAPPGLPYPWNRFDYGYVITAHKSQGSEFNNVLILDEPVGSTDEERRRWRYTAITRSAKNCILVQP